MITLITLCDWFWLLWLLPLLLGALITWLYWKNKYSNMVAEYDGKINGLNGRISGLDGDLADCGAKRSELEGDLSITKGRMREIESEMKSLQDSIDSNSKVKSASSSIAPMAITETSSNIDAVSDTSQDIDTTVDAVVDAGSDTIDAAIDAVSDIESGIDSPVNLANVASSLTGGAVGSGSASSGSGGSAKKSIYSGVKSDNLQIIEGIGPKMESVLKENGVSTHAELGSKTPDELQAILGKYGDKYKIIDPTTWAQQAGYAASGDYEGLIDLQKKLDTGRDNATNTTASKLEKYLIKTGALKAFKQDDLKAIEGIGPATEKLLHSNGIKTWRDLANTEASAVKAMLTAAGSRFALGDPTTWPKQAELAADGKFDELREYQDYLDGGKG